jgi:hypothetical protein
LTQKNESFVSIGQRERKTIGESEATATGALTRCFFFFPFTKVQQLHVTMIRLRKEANTKSI